MYLLWENICVGRFFRKHLLAATLGLCCCRWAFSSGGEQGLLLIAVRRLLTAAAAFAAQPGLQVVGFGGPGSGAQELGLGGCGSWTYLLRSMEGFPGPGIKPTSFALAGGFSTTGPSRKFSGPFFNWIVLFFPIFWAMLHVIQGLSSLPRDQTRAPGNESISPLTFNIK